MKLKPILFSTLLCFILHSKPSFADFYSALNDYEQQNYQPAFEGFLKMAEMGEKRAQFNLGVMYFNGQYVKKDLNQAYAWIRLAAESDTVNPELKQALTEIEKQVADTEKAESTYAELKAKYSTQTLINNLYPTLIAPSNQAAFDAKPIEMITPDYPRKAALKGIQGWVRFQFDLDKKGYPRNLTLLESAPEDTFVKAARKAILKWRFSPANGASQDDFSRKNLHFSMYFQMAENIDVKKDLYQDIRNSALSGNADALFNLGFIQLKLPSSREENENPNQWFLEAAMQDHAKAQYYLGESLINGKGCIEDKSKGIEWLTRSATNGEDLAKQRLGSLAASQLSLDNHKQAKNWLSSAKQLDASGIIDLSWLLATSPYPEVAEPKRALELIETIKENYWDKVTPLEIKAAAFAALGDFSNAIAMQRSALDKAENRGIDLSEIQQHLETLERNQVWF